MSDFGLTPSTGPPPGYVTPAECCRGLDITPTPTTPALSKWRAANAWEKERDGQPPIAVLRETKHGPTWFYDLARVKAWAAGRGQGVGGPRPGSGRKKKGSDDAPPPRPLRSDEETKADGTRAAMDPESPIEAAALADQAERTEAKRRRLMDPMHLLEQADDDSVTRVSTQKRRDLIAAAGATLELMARRGELQETESVRRVWLEQINRMVIGMQTLPLLAAADVLAALGLPPDKAPAVRAAIERRVDELRHRLVDESERAAGRVHPGTAAA